MSSRSSSGSVPLDVCGRYFPLWASSRTVALTDCPLTVVTDQDDPMIPRGVHLFRTIVVYPLHRMDDGVCGHRSPRVFHSDET